MNSSDWELLLVKTFLISFVGEKGSYLEASSERSGLRGFLGLACSDLAAFAAFTTFS